MAFPSAELSQYKLQSKLRIAAVDFGTTYTSLAYVLPKDGIVVNMPINSSSATERVPTAILLKKESNGALSVDSFGSEAQTQVVMLNPAEVPEYLYFECFKMKLRGEESVSIVCMCTMRVCSVLVITRNKQSLFYPENHSKFDSAGVQWRKLLSSGSGCIYPTPPQGTIAGPSINKRTIFFN